MATASATLADKPLFLEAVGADTDISYDADALRDLIAAIWRGRGGLRRGSFQISQRSPSVNWSVDIAGGFYIVGEDTTAGARYLVRGTSVVNLSVAAFNTAPAAMRTHKVWLAVYDENFAATDTYEARLLITEDTGSGAPLPSTLTPVPAFYQQLGSFTISPSQAHIADSHITNILTYADYSTVTSIDLLTGFTSAATESGQSSAPRCLNTFGEVKLKGAVKKTSGNFAPDTHVSIGNVPTTYRPPATRYGVATGQATANSATITCRVTIEANGLVTVSIPAAPSGDPGWAPQWITFDGVSYEMND